MTAKKPSEQLRASPKARAIKTLSKTPKPFPSERRSTNLKKKLAKWGNVEEKLEQDCRDCTDDCKYDHNLNKCYKPSHRDRCLSCGVKYQFLFIFGKPYYCATCRERRKIMTSFNTCASPGCDERIVYEKGEKPEKYCQMHLPSRDTRSNLIPSITPNPTPESFVVMKCPTCKTTEVILKSDWMLKPTMACTHCIGVMIYHKDKPEPKTLHDKATIQNDSIGWN